MRIWIDLSNSPHALLFPPIAARLEELGHEVLITARDNAQTVDLARPRFPGLTVIGEESPAKTMRKAAALGGRVGALVQWARATKPELALSHNSYAQVIAARLLRIPSVTAMDYEYQPANHVAFRLAARVLLPEAMRPLNLRRFGLRARRTRFYPGLKEEIYLANFSPDPAALARAGIETGSSELLVVGRTPPSRAAYHHFENELFGEAVKVAASEPNARVVVLARHSEQRDALRALDLPDLLVPDVAVEARELMYDADLVIGAGGTMTREAALLRVPTFSAFAGAQPAVDRWLQEKGLLRRLERAEDILPLEKRRDKPVPLEELGARQEELTEWFVENIVDVVAARRPRAVARAERKAARRPRLCMVVHGSYPLGEPRVAREARVALREGFDVNVIALRGEGEARRECVDGIDVLRMPIRHRRGRHLVGMIVEYVGFSTLTVGRLAIHPRRYKVIQIHNPPDFLVVAGLIPKLFGTRLLFDIHDLSPDMFEVRFENRRGSRLADRLLHLIERLATRLADGVITVHDPYRRELIGRTRADPGKVAVVMNSVDEDLLPAPPKVDEDLFRVVYHGTITRWYGVQTLIEAAAIARETIPSIRVEIYGDGDTLPLVRERIEAGGLSDVTMVTGHYLPHRETLAAINGASVGVVPNLPTRLNRFALSSKLFEYVMLGVPVVCSRLPTLEEYFAENEMFFFSPGDPESLATALVAIATDPGEAASRAARARVHCEDYRWSENADRYAAMLEAR